MAIQDRLRALANDPRIAAVDLKKAADHIDYLEAQVASDAMYIVGLQNEIDDLRNDIEVLYDSMPEEA